MDIYNLTAKQLENIIENANSALELDFDDTEARSLLIQTQLRKAEITHQRRPDINYWACSLKADTRLTYKLAPDEDVKVSSSRKLAWKGQEISLTALTEKLGKRYRVPNNRSKYWYVGERRLDDIYDETYGPLKS